jgi:hypothetical protein
MLGTEAKAGTCEGEAPANGSIPDARAPDGCTVRPTDEIVKVPIYGHAESMNLATAASVCLYERAFAQR